MGISLLAALLLTVAGLLAQSPRWLARLGLTGLRLDLRLRTLNQLALAAMLLTVGFFAAGVPLERGPSDTAVNTDSGPNVVQTATAAALAVLPATPDVAGTIDPAAPSPTPGVNAPSSGAFGGGSGATNTPAISGGDFLPDPTTTATIIGTPSAATFTSTPATTANTATATATATPTATPTPTATATPTVTPTPIDGETAVISTQGSTLWVRRSPGGQQLSLVRDGDVVILQNGRGNQGGVLWREIRTVAGTLGWVQEEFLAFDES